MLSMKSPAARRGGNRSFVAASHKARFSPSVMRRGATRGRVLPCPGGLAAAPGRGPSPPAPSGGESPAGEAPAGAPLHDCLGVWRRARGVAVALSERDEHEAPKTASNTPTSVAGTILTGSAWSRDTRRLRASAPTSPDRSRPADTGAPRRRPESPLAALAGR